MQDTDIVTFRVTWSPRSTRLGTRELTAADDLLEKQRPLLRNQRGARIPGTRQGQLLGRGQHLQWHRGDGVGLCGVTDT